MHKAALQFKSASFASHDVIKPHLLSHSVLSTSGKKTQEGRSCTLDKMTWIVFILHNRTRNNITSASRPEPRDCAEEILNWDSFLLWYLRWSHDKADSSSSYSPQNGDHQRDSQPAETKPEVAPKVDSCPCQSFLGELLGQTTHSRSYWGKFTEIHFN